MKEKALENQLRNPPSLSRMYHIKQHKSTHKNKIMRSKTAKNNTKQHVIVYNCVGMLYIGCVNAADNSSEKGGVRIERSYQQNRTMPKGIKKGV